MMFSSTRCDFEKNLRYRYFALPMAVIIKVGLVESLKYIVKSYSNKVYSAQAFIKIEMRKVANIQKR